MEGLQRDIGENCSLCSALDFLPVICDHCRKVFCPKHITPSAIAGNKDHCHDCVPYNDILAKEKARQDAVGYVGLGKLHKEGMDKVRNRFDGPEYAYSTKTHYRIKAKPKPIEETRSDKLIQKAKERLENENISDKQKRISSQVRKTLIKQKAVGKNKNLEIDDRYFLEVVFQGNENGIAVAESVGNQQRIYLYFSRLWTAGRAIDEIVSGYSHLLPKLLPNQSYYMNDKDSEELVLPLTKPFFEFDPNTIQNFDTVEIVALDPKCITTVNVDEQTDNMISAEDHSVEETKKTYTIGVGTLPPAPLPVSISVEEKHPQHSSLLALDVKSDVSLSADKLLTLTVQHGKGSMVIDKLNFENTTVLDLKVKIMELSGIPLNKQKLIYKGTLNDTELLKDTKVKCGCKVMLMSQGK